MEHEVKKTNAHVLRKTFWSVIALVVIGGLGYGATRFRDIKSSIDGAFSDSGVVKERDTASLLKHDKPISILLLGTDTGAFGRSYRGRTDTMMVITLNPQTNKTTITSIPRDTAVNIPGFASESPAKINAAYAYGKAKTSIATVQKLLNIPIDFYALVNMGGLEKVVNQVGGVDVVPTMSFSYEGYDFQKGVKTHMDGKEALQYSRMRYQDPNGDYGRQTRQREVLTALMHKSDSVSTLLNQSFIDSIANETQTDLTFDDLIRITKDYKKSTKEVAQTHLQGTGHEINYEDMEVVGQSELQRVTDFIRKGLDLKYEDTGNIEYVLGE